jgi:hypothetical protein
MKTRKVRIGIDPGLNGGISIIIDGQLVEHKELPNIIGKDLNFKALYKLIESYLDAYDHVLDVYCVIEKVHGMMHWGVSNNFAFGGYYRATKAILEILEIPFTEVQPKTWQKEMLQGVSPIIDSKGKMETKKMAELAILKIHPSGDFRASDATDRAKKLHDGIVDSVLLATYCNRNF